MAMRRVDLERLGGFSAFKSLLAEDAVMGQRFAAAGMRVATSFAPIENRNVRGSLRRTFDRHARWAKMRRALSPAFFAIEPFFSPALVASASFALVPCRRTAAMLACALLLQTTTSWASAWVVRGRPLAWRYLPLEAVRLLVMLGCWLSACMSRTVVWRGHALTIGPGTVLSRPRATDEGESSAAHPA